MSYRSLGFPMGCSTDFSGEGIVGNHAYSILDIRELHDIQLGEQLSIRTFLRDQSSSLLPPLPPSREEECLREVQFTGQLRLLRIRNPWGKREWNGNFSSHSSLWTTKLKQLLSSTSSNSNASCSVDHQDGSFWITFTDFLRRFVTIDICKAYQPSPPSSSSSCSSWKIHCLEDLIDSEVAGEGGGREGSWQSISTRSSFLLTIHESPTPRPPTPTYLSLLQESQRGNPQRRALPDRYSDLSALIRRYPSGEMVGSIFSAPMRSTCPLEITLEPPGRFLIQVMKFSPSCLRSPVSPPSSGGLRRYWLHLYSAQPLVIQPLPSSSPPPPSPHPLRPALHMPGSLIHFLDDLTSPPRPQNSSLSMLTHLCSSSAPFPPNLQIDVFLLRGNGMNLLFCRSRSFLPLPSVPASAPVLPSPPLIDLSSEDDQSSSSPASKHNDWIELTALHRSSRLRILSPFLSAPVTMTQTPPTMTAIQIPVHGLATSSFRFRCLQRNQIKVLGIVFDTTGGSDSFEFLGEVYFHTATARIIPATATGFQGGSHEGDSQEEPSHFRSYDCK
jgi:hypothetical protein